jgi:taurine dioxygenase
MGVVIELERERVSTLTVAPLQPTIGAAISGIDLRLPLSDEDRDQIKAALLKYKVMEIDRRQHLAFAKRFGAIYTPPYLADQLIDVDGESGLHRIFADKEQVKIYDSQRRPGLIYDGRSPMGLH